jgi:hypothetical protein
MHRRTPVFPELAHAADLPRAHLDSVRVPVEDCLKSYRDGVNRALRLYFRRASG